jgi:hypothetical protein
MLKNYLISLKLAYFCRKYIKNMELINKSLRDCTLTFMDKVFKMRQPDTLPDLEDWVNRSNDISDFERQNLLHYQRLLKFNVHNWNEAELDVHFIGPIFSLVNFSSFDFNHFSQREISGTVDNYFLSGKPDSMVASGRREPEKPFFAFQEYKRELDPDGDPAGQALAAMLVGQQMEEVQKTMYGCYVVGGIWKFMALNTDRKYAISKDFSATDDDIFSIFCILKNLKDIVIERTNGKN